MRLPFRQGIVKYSSNNDKIPTFLYFNKWDEYIKLIVDNNNLLITFAHNDVDYLLEETVNVDKTWGPFTDNKKYWLYWDIDVKTAKRTFGYTTQEPINSFDIPENASEDQHWFNLKDNYIITYDSELQQNSYKKISKNGMYVWDGGYWIPKIRVFAGTFYNGEIKHSSLWSQVGLHENCDAGFILYDDSDTPTQQARVDGTYKFLTTVSPFTDTKVVTTTVSLSPIVHYGKASVPLLKNDLVSLSDNGDFIKASSYLLPAIGFVKENVAQNQICMVVNKTNIEDSSWNFQAEPSSPIYLSPTGISTTPPEMGVIQKIGYVVSPTNIFVDISNPLVYYDGVETNQSEQVKLDVYDGRLYTTLVNSTESTCFVTYNLYSLTYKQPIPNTRWTIIHNSHLLKFLVQIYDELGNCITPSNITRIDDKTIEVVLPNRTSGTALVFLF